MATQNRGGGGSSLSGDVKKVFSISNCVPITLTLRQSTFFEQLRIFTGISVCSSTIFLSWHNGRNLLPTSTGGWTFCNIVWSHAIKSTASQRQIPTEKKSVDEALSTRDLGTRWNPGCGTIGGIPYDTYMKTFMKSFRRRTRLVAVDGSEHSKKAFECKLYMITRLSFIIISFVFQNALRK